MRHRKNDTVLECAFVTLAGLSLVVVPGCGGEFEEPLEGESSPVFLGAPPIEQGGGGVPGPGGGGIIPIGSTPVKVTAKGCRIESSQRVCKNKPHVTFPRMDNWNGSGTDVDACKRRARAFGRWCGFGSHVYVKATSIKGMALGGYVFDVSETWVRQGCLVKVGACPAHPWVAHKTRMDNYQNAGTNQSRCLRRAMDYTRWCKAPANGSFGASAAYYSAEVLRAYKKVTNLCLGSSCNGKNSNADPQKRCFSNTNTPYTTSRILKDSGGRWAATLDLDGAGNCDGYVRASVAAWQWNAPRYSTVWLEQRSVGKLPGTQRSGNAGRGTRADDLYSGMHRRNGQVRACAIVNSGGGLGRGSGCTGWR